MQRPLFDATNGRPPPARARAAWLISVAAWGVSCAKPVASPRAVSAAPPTWAYEVVANGLDLSITATLPPGSSQTLSLEDGAAPFVADLDARTSAGAQAKAEARNGVWTVPACAGGCTLSYRFHLAAAARALHDIDSAVSIAGSVSAPPSTWLLRPTESPAGATYRFHVAPSPTVRFATGVRPIPGAADTYGASAEALDTAPYSVFGAFRARTLARADTTIEVAALGPPLAMDDAAIDHWIDLSARAIDAYYGHFPVPRFLLIVVPGQSEHGELAEGLTLASGGASILLAVASTMTAKDIPRDWVLTHEMTHLALPNLRREHHWLEEGLATYVEPIARAKVGTIPEREMWKGLVEGLPQGEPETGDEGIDRTHTWGRTYWGGALFSFVADIEIRRATGNKRSLADALAGILAKGGTGEARWPIEDALRVGDQATGVTVLEDLHAKWATTPVAVDLARIWGELGVRHTGDDASFDDDAPLASIRRSIVGTSPPR